MGALMFELFVAHMGGCAPFSCNHVEQPGRTLFCLFPECINLGAKIVSWQQG